MKPYRLTPAAEDDLFEIWTSIAPDDSTAADSLELEFYDSFQRLADRIDLGHYRRDLTGQRVRFFTVRGTYLIVYDPASEPLEILRVLHGARDLTQELEQ